MSLSSRKERMRSDMDFGVLKFIYYAMDNFFLDPILGFFIPGLGDVTTTFCTIPFVFTTVFRLRSVALTLAVVNNALIDMLCGLFPVVGDIIDVLNRSYRKSYKQIVGYVEGDAQIISTVNSSAFGACIWITILCVLIRLIVYWLSGLFGWYEGLFV